MLSLNCKNSKNSCNSKEKFSELFVRTKKCRIFANGKLAEWSNAAVLKTVDLNGSGGSNPSLSAEKETDKKSKEFSKNFFAFFFFFKDFFQKNQEKKLPKKQKLFLTSAFSLLFHAFYVDYFFGFKKFSFKVVVYVVDFDFVFYG